MKNINKLVVTIGFALTAFSSWSAEFQCGDHVKLGIPSQSSQLLCREGYAAGYNYDTKVSDWVSYRMTETSAQGNVTRTNKFAEDKDVPVQFRATLADYHRSGYDRGHQAPAADMRSTTTTMKESFLLTNMTPQLPELNRGAWRILEEKARQWAITYKDVYVITGPVFTGSDESIGNGVTVPNGYYKIVMDIENKEAIAFIIPQENIQASKLADYIVTVDEVEERTGLDFFSELPDEEEEAMESKRMKMWG
ncbi:DNA/RNA non-specific endonuclease [Aeromonas salmonicida]|uniref:DNA/RNA non-specific endonuclease n=1 Tax=Aeromonas salmonicida TaxID=645 RepID=UPI000F7A98AD|nr:DNA/RNA non-specific endonuclease [Aeromonas salmonicida]RSM21615.1 DNA/RNA endonuclease G [Aeromonas salmonicida]VFB10077.1 DNA/RNA non-specific endonuclease [Aeromonas salmonicida]